MKSIWLGVALVSSCGWTGRPRGCDATTTPFASLFWVSSILLSPPLLVPLPHALLTTLSNPYQPSPFSPFVPLSYTPCPKHPKATIPPLPLPSPPPQIGNLPHAEITFKAPDGAEHRALFMIDSGAGGADLLFHGRSTRELGLVTQDELAGRGDRSRVRSVRGVGGEGQSPIRVVMGELEWADWGGVRFEKVRGRTGFGGPGGGAGVHRNSGTGRGGQGGGEGEELGAALCVATVGGRSASAVCDARRWLQHPLVLQHAGPTFIAPRKREHHLHFTHPATTTFHLTRPRTADSPQALIPAALLPYPTP